MENEIAWKDSRYREGFNIDKPIKVVTINVKLKGGLELKHSWFE